MSKQDVMNDIVLSPDPRLRTECTPIEEIDDSIRELAARMLEDMYAAEGCGLAAPQVGETIQLVVIDVDYDGEDESTRNPYVLVNPKIITADGDPELTSEGCLSFPGIAVPVERPSHVVVQARNLDGVLLQYEASNNLMCVCLQHEIDHLHGKTMIDHLTLEQRVQALKAYDEALEAGAKPGQVSLDEE